MTDNSKESFVSQNQLLNLFVQVCGKADPFFTNIQDVTGRYNISPVAKVLVAIKQLAYGCSPSAFMDYFQMSETLARRSLIKFSTIVSTKDELQSVYGRQMTRSDARRLSALHEACHGVAGMVVGSLDCMHVGWKNCPVAWQGANKGKLGKPTIVLEAMADHNLWFWHHSFGWPGSLNDRNIWNRSCLLKAFLDGSFARDVDFEFTIGDEKVFNRLWILVDGIYPELSRFVKTLQEPVGRRACRYAVWQESARKDVERAFGVLQRKFHLLVGKIELWYVSNIASVVKCCLCLHNMMVASRMAQDEEESEDFYAFPGLARGDDTPVAGGVADEAEQVYVDRRAAEMHLHAQLYGTNNQQDDTMTDRERRILESLRLQYVQRRWECLYDLDEHLRLRDSIMDHIEA
ncbi:Ribosomal protein-like protein [Fragilaria crotonensis]|nr:Ribosomal protein-like protein [Fragilaria crotonensis]KAI2494474.1 Ribosomal protein-like protein [Fragilaria crotonensis]